MVVLAALPPLLKKPLAEGLFCGRVRAAPACVRGRVDSVFQACSSIYPQKTHAIAGL